jgi:hypothetical protein
MNQLLLAVILLAVAAPSVAAEPDVTGFEIVRFGIYERDVASTRRDGDGVLQHTFKNVRFVSSTTTVPAKLGLSFGVDYKIAGTPDGAKIEARRVMRFPAPGGRPPGAAKPLASNTVAIYPALNTVRYSGYTLEEPWELLPGTWTIEFWYGERKLGAQDFTIVPP